MSAGDGRPSVLFVCTHNAGRSQMAAALLAARSGGRVDVRSRGLEPAERMNAMVVEAMAEIGIDLSQAVPTPLRDEDLGASDIVVTMACSDACPIFPGKRYMDWPVGDPKGVPIETVRAIRDDIEERVQGLLVDLGIV